MLRNFLLKCLYNAWTMDYMGIKTDDIERWNENEKVAVDDEMNVDDDVGKNSV